jgi:hypothetical protein
VIRSDQFAYSERARAIRSIAPLDQPRTPSILISANSLHNHILIISISIFVIEEENWDGDFDFAPSPPRSPILAITPITCSQTTNSNNGTPPLPSQQENNRQQLGCYHSNSDLRSVSAIPRHTSTLGRSAKFPSATRPQPGPTSHAQPPKSHDTPKVDEPNTTTAYSHQHQSMLGRLGSLKRWGHTSVSPSTTGRSNFVPVPVPTTNTNTSTPDPRLINPFWRVSIQGVKRFVGNHHHCDHREQQQQRRSDSPSTTLVGTLEKKKGHKDNDILPGAGNYHCSISFSSLVRGKLGATVEKSSRPKDATAAGRKSSDGRQRSPVAWATANPSVPHMLGQTAILTKAPRPPPKPLSPAPVGSSADTVAIIVQPVSYGHASLARASQGIGYGRSKLTPLPSSISTAASSRYQSSTTSAADSSSRKRTTSAATTATTSSQSQPSPISALPPFTLANSRPYQDSQRPSVVSRTRQATINPSPPRLPAIKSISKPRENAKPLPKTTPKTRSAATIGRLEGKSTAVHEAREVGMRRGSVGDSARSPGLQSRDGGDLKIPASIGMRQGSLKRELEAVKEFAASVDGPF